MLFLAGNAPAAAGLRLPPCFRYFVAAFDAGAPDVNGGLSRAAVQPQGKGLEVLVDRLGAVHFVSHYCSDPLTKLSWGNPAALASSIARLISAGSVRSAVLIWIRLPP